MASVNRGLIMAPVLQGCGFRSAIISEITEVYLEESRKISLQASRAANRSPDAQQLTKYCRTARNAAAGRPASLAAAKPAASAVAQDVSSLVCAWAVWLPASWHRPAVSAQTAAIGQRPR